MIEIGGVDAALGDLHVRLRDRLPPSFRKAFGGFTGLVDVDAAETRTTMPAAYSTGKDRRCTLPRGCHWASVQSAHNEHHPLPARRATTRRRPVGPVPS
jgi:hypothetical protein